MLFLGDRAAVRMLTYMHFTGPSRDGHYTLALAINAVVCGEDSCCIPVYINNCTYLTHSCFLAITVPCVSCSGRNIFVIFWLMLHSLSFPCSATKHILGETGFKSPSMTTPWGFCSWEQMKTSAGCCQTVVSYIYVVCELLCLLLTRHKLTLSWMFACLAVHSI